jgi:hypothetical protein
VRDSQPVIDGGASTTAPGHVEAFPNDVLHSPLLLRATPLAIPANAVLNSPAPYCQQIPSQYVSSYSKAERSLGEAKSLAHRAALRAEAAR